jgi:uncharacterized membrane protein YsdA (DUF1294 family)
MHFEQMVIGSLAAINIFAFLLMGYDKSISMQGRNIRRIPEKTLFTTALVFGAIGIYLGMLTFRHKTKKWYFQLGIPLLILQNLATIYLIKEIL